MKSWRSTQGSVATSVAEAEYYAALKGAADLPRWQGTSATNSKSSSGVIRQQREQPYSSHGGEILVAAGCIGKRTAGLEKGAHERQPCRCCQKAHSSRKNEKAISAGGL